MKKTGLFIILLLSITTLISAQRNIKGTVVNSNGEPLIGASVLVKSTTLGVVTDIDGKFSLDVPKNAQALIFSYAGFTTEEVAIGVSDVIYICLSEVLLPFIEIVCTGLGSPRVVDTKSTGKTLFPSTKAKKKAKKEHKLLRDSLEKTDGFNTEEYGYWLENNYKSPKDEALSTFSIDVDRASYTNVRRFIERGTKPPAGAVRIEEMVNYFDYKYPQPQNEHPLSIISEIGTCPWNKDHVLLHIGLQGKKIDLATAPKNNLVFLIDVSGSMDAPNKLPLVKDALRILINNLRDEDRVAIVVYAGAAGCVLPSTLGANKSTILASLNKLDAGGSTAGGEGIQLAYKIATENFVKDGNNRIILATDGDFNVGVSSASDLISMIETQRKSGVFLSVCGFGTGNYKDSKMEQLADKGNGNYAYIDKIGEAKKVFGKEMGGTLYTIAKDVKLQLEFNPSIVESYRLIGYENRLLNKEDFNDDTKDAGEIGADHTVTALYEIVPKGVETTEKETPSVDKLRYQKTKTKLKSNGNEMVFVKLRYKKPKENKSILMEQAVVNQGLSLEKTSDNFRFSAAVAGFAQILRGSKFVGDFDLGKAKALAMGSFGADTEGYRADFVKLIELAEGLDLTAKR